MTSNNTPNLTQLELPSFQIPRQDDDDNDSDSSDWDRNNSTSLVTPPAVPVCQYKSGINKFSFFKPTKN